jgi:hypothetical protein
MNRGREQRSGPPSRAGATTVAPYRKAAPPGGPQLKRIYSTHTLELIKKREKVLPPDANSKATSCKLYQLEEPVVFGCAGCGKDGIVFDSLAADTQRNVILCVRCFTKLVRPRQFRPSRLVPFPSLLSWLKYEPPTVSRTPTDVTMRAAEAVAPSGRRLAEGGLRPTDLSSLPANAMSSTVAEDDVGVRELLADRRQTHPCERVWGTCKHGPVCYFKSAPRDLCIEYLMGIATEEQAAIDGLSVEKGVFDLPQVEDPIPLPDDVRTLTESQLSDPASPINEWRRRRKKSANRAEWQLFNNGPVELVLRQCVAVADDDVGFLVDAIAAAPSSTVAEDDGQGVDEDGLGAILDSFL